MSHFMWFADMLWNLKAAFSKRLRQRHWLAYSYHTQPKMWRTKRSQKFCAEMAARPGSVRVCGWLCVCAHLLNTACLCCSVCDYAHTLCAHRATCHSNCFIRQWQSVNHGVREGRQQREDCCPAALLTVTTTLVIIPPLSLHVERNGWDHHSSLKAPVWLYVANISIY